MNIQWYPGHMAKADRIISENIKLVDVVIEIMDARIPISSRNPAFDRMLAGKKRIAVLNKSDLADPIVSERWTKYFQEKNIPAVFISAKNKKDVLRIEKAAIDVMREKIEKLKSKGILQPAIKAMIVGIPNVGKSTLINTIAGKSVAATGDKPGITRGKQWIKLGSRLELLDTPGILWPKFENQILGQRLAFTGAIKDDVLDGEELALLFIQLMLTRYPGIFKERYDVDTDESDGYIHMLENIGRRRGCVVSGGITDCERASDALLRDFRNGKLGRITLDIPEENE